MNLTDTIQSERNETQKNTYCMIPFTSNTSQTKLTSSDINQISICLVWGVGREGRRKRLTEKRKTLRKLAVEIEVCCIFTGVVVTQVKNLLH